MPSAPSAAPVAKRRPGCLTTVFGVVVLAVIVGSGAWLWDAVVEAPWAHALPLVGTTAGGVPATLTGEWLGDVTSPSGRLHGVVWLRIERRQWGGAGRTRGVSGPSHPDFGGTARVCGLADAAGPRKLWGWASRDASLVHATIPFAPGPAWNLGALDGAWDRDGGTLTLTGRLDDNGGSARGGAPADTREPTRITLRPGREAEFERRCAVR
jgi:hypothetical protein